MSLLLAALLVTTHCSAAEKSSVLLLSIDNLRADRVTPELMPRLHALGREALRFNRTYSPATWTLPSHATLLSGRHPSAHGAGGTSLSPRPMRGDGPTLAEVLSRAGWRTMSVGNASFFRRELGLTRGFAPQLVNYWAMDTLPHAGRLFEALRKPAFLFVHSFRVHAFIHDRGEAKYEDCAMPEYVKPEGRETDCAQLRRSYDRAARCADRSFGRLVDELKDARIWDDALVVVTSDHGESLCDGHEGARRGHEGLPYEEQVRVPLFVKLPGGRRGGEQTDEPAHLVDVAPTVLDALGLAPEPAFSGKSLLRPGPPRERVIHLEGEQHSGAAYAAVIVGGWKLIETGGSVQLYDLGSDPEERHGLSDPGREARLRGLLPKRRGARAGAPSRGMPVEELRATGYLP